MIKAGGELPDTRRWDDWIADGSRRQDDWIVDGRPSTVTPWRDMPRKTDWISKGRVTMLVDGRPSTVTMRVGLDMKVTEVYLIGNGWETLCELDHHLTVRAGDTIQMTGITHDEIRREELPTRAALPSMFQRIKPTPTAATITTAERPLTPTTASRAVG